MKAKDDGVLTFHATGRNQEFVHVYTPVLFGGDLRFEFDFRFRKGAHVLSLTLNHPDPREREEEKGYSFQMVSRGRRGLALLREGRAVVGARSPEYKPRTWYHATMERAGDHFSVRIDGELLYGYTDPIPLRGGHLALLGSSLGLDIRNAKLWSRGASSMVSCLAVPDAFYNQGLYQKARTEYLRIAWSLTGRREGRLAGFRAGLCYLEEARRQKSGRRRDQLLRSARGQFTQLGRRSTSCLSGLGLAIVASELGEVVEMPRGGLLIDLCDCTFIDSLGVAAVVRAAKEMRRRDRSLAVATSSPQVRRVLSLTGADELLDVHWSREDAVDRLAERLGRP